MHSSKPICGTLTVLAAALNCQVILAQTPSPTDSGKELTAPVELTAHQDHQRIMNLLNITSLRPGVNGNNPNAPDAANYNEAKANPYPNLPDPLLLKSGKRVTTASAWWRQRRPEIVEDFDREVYGRPPARTPGVKWEVKSAKHEMRGEIPVITKTLVGHVDNGEYPQISVDIQLTLCTPEHTTGKVPVMMQFGFIGGFGGGFGRPPAGAAGAQPRPAFPAPPNGAPAVAPRPAFPGPPGGFGGAAFGPSWQDQVLAKGWGYAVISPNSIQADNGGGLTKGIIGLVNKGQPRKPDDWGVLRAWAWGASRALDYFTTDPAVDARQVGIEGHSRYGKAALVTLAFDQRFAIGYISSSGAGGAKLHRRNAGELVENVAGEGEYHWMAGNFVKYAGPLTAGDLPVDSHELIALCAPRPVFVSAGNVGDAWVDARGSFMAAVGAGPVYRLLGKKDLGASDFPAVETGLTTGEIAFRQHNSGHTDAPNWPTFLTFAGRYMKVKGQATGGGRQETGGRSQEEWE